MKNIELFALLSKSFSEKTKNIIYITSYDVNDCLHAFNFLSSFFNSLTADFFHSIFYKAIMFN